MFLVDLLTRFLYEFRSFSLPEQDSIEKDRFLEVMAREILKRQETDIAMKSGQESEIAMEVLETISSFFQDELTAPINLLLLRQSVKAFNTFLTVYNDQKT